MLLDPTRHPIRVAMHIAQSLQSLYGLVNVSTFKVRSWIVHIFAEFYIDFLMAICTLGMLPYLAFNFNIVNLILITFDIGYCSETPKLVSVSQHLRQPVNLYYPVNVHGAQGH